MSFPTTRIGYLCEVVLPSTWGRTGKKSSEGSSLDTTLCSALDIQLFQIQPLHSPVKRYAAIANFPCPVTALLAVCVRVATINWAISLLPFFFISLLIWCFFLGRLSVLRISVLGSLGGACFCRWQRFRRRRQRHLNSTLPCQR